MQNNSASGVGKQSPLPVPEKNIAQALRRAMSCHQSERYAEAEVICQHVLQSAPQHPEALYLLGLIFSQKGRHEEVIALLSQAISVDPTNPTYYNLLGNAYNKGNNPEAAVSSYQKAISLKANYAAARYNLGNTFLGQGKLEEAIVSLKRALLFSTEETSIRFKAEINMCLGNALLELGRYDDAIASFEQTLLLRPDFFEAHNNMGNAYLSLNQLEKAVECYRQVLLLKPDYADGHSNYLLAIHYSPKMKAEAIRVAHVAFAEQFEAPLRQQWPLYPPVPSAGVARRIRVGFVSGDFCGHPVAYFIEAVLSHLHAETLEIFLYYNHTLIDDTTLRCKSLGHHWRSLAGATDAIAADMVKADLIDILVDLSGHTAFNRLLLFARKPAPVQVTWLGYFDTTGLQAMDYILGDPYVLPLAEENHFVEKPWRLPESYLCFTSPQENVPIAPLPAINNGFVTFGSFNKISKMNEEVIALWSKVLLSVPDARLLLKTRQLNDQALCADLVQRFSAYGVSPERLIMEGGGPRHELLAAYNRVDIALDPFPYPGGTTTLEGLWMGVPVITRSGDRFLSHIGESIAHNAGMSDWIAIDDEDYVAKAVIHSADLKRLATLRLQLRQQVLDSPLFDAPRFARHFTEALTAMWEQWLKKRNKKSDFSRTPWDESCQ